MTATMTAAIASARAQPANHRPRSAVQGFGAIQGKRTAIGKSVSSATGPAAAMPNPIAPPATIQPRRLPSRQAIAKPQSASTWKGRKQSSGSVMTA